MYDIVVIGAGPAGLTAGIYGVRAGKKVLVLEALAYGGQIVNAQEVDNYPGLPHVNGFDFAMNLYNQASDLGVDIKIEKATDIVDGLTKKVITEKNEYECKSIILAMGVKNRKLGIDREDELVGKGLSYCATCDGNFYKKKDVAVQGGGNVALDDALYLSNIVNKVYLIHRRDEFRGEQATVELLKTLPNVEFVLNSNVTSLNGKDKLESITVVNNKTDEARNIEVSALFVAIGQIPENNNITNNINLSDGGYIIAGEDMTTNKDGIYVAGDIRVKEVRQLATAISDGAVAATQAIKYINEMKTNSFMLKIHKKNMINETDIFVDNDKISYSSITKAPGQEEEVMEEKIIDDKEIIKDFISTIYDNSKQLLLDSFDQVKQLDKVTRSKNTAVNDLSIIDNGFEMKFDCYIQEYENLPSLFTVEVEKFVKDQK